MQLSQASNYIRRRHVASLLTGQKTTLAERDRQPNTSRSVHGQDGPCDPKGSDKGMKTNVKTADPIQRLFLEKIRERTTQGCTSAELQSPYKDELQREIESLGKKFNFGKGDPTKMPEFEWKDPPLDPINESVAPTADPGDTAAASSALDAESTANCKAKDSEGEKQEDDKKIGKPEDSKK